MLAGNLDRVAGRAQPAPSGSSAFGARAEGRTAPRDPRPFVAERLLVSGGSSSLVGRDISDKLRTQQLLLNAILLGGGLMIVLGLVGGFVMSRWTLGRLERVNRTTAAIMAGDLDRRIEVEGGGDEFDELAINLNRMLERIERLLAGMREVTDNVAHDLRTPLSRLRSRLEVALMRPLDEAATRELLEATVKRCRRADRHLQRASEHRESRGREQAVANGSRSTSPSSPATSSSSTSRSPRRRASGWRSRSMAPCRSIGNRQLIAQALANVTDNAIKYTPEGGRVRVSTGLLPGPHLEVRRRRARHSRGASRRRRWSDSSGWRRTGRRPATASASASSAPSRACTRPTLELGDAGPGLKVKITFKRPLLLAA